MKNTKTLFAAALIAACAISQPVLAAATESATQPTLNTLVLESTDLSFAFEQTTQPLQMATLSEQEMKETEGAWVVIASRAGWGALGGFSSYWGQYSATGQWSTSGLFRSVGGGAVGGLFGVNPASAALIGSGVSSFISNFNWR